MNDNQPERAPSTATLLSAYLDEGVPQLDAGPKFLEENNTFEKVALVSYPRSGNSLLRGHLERITGVLTGSDGKVTRSLNA